MGNTSTSETQGTAGAQSPQARRIMELMAGTASGATEQMGDLSAIAGGNFNITPEQQALINQIQTSTGDSARAGMEQNMESVLRQLEDTNIGRQITGGSLEAVNNALVGQESLRSVDALAMQQQGQSAQMGLNVPFQAAQAQTGANAALMQRLVGAGGAGLNYDALIRQLNSSSYGETTQPLTQTIIGGAAEVGAARVGA